ncbi:hypothetical protein Bbelb_277430 [Branchiostoma belcheri]|nr:hypothetical protein Bbelb_277430 [Branchiostoma belcheri]
MDLFRKISNAELYNRTGCSKLTTEITGRRLKWLGHVLRMPDNRIPKVALNWRPEGKRKRGRPKTTWRRTVSDDLAAMGLSWKSVNNMAQDRPRWRKKLEGVASTHVTRPVSQGVIVCLVCNCLHATPGRQRLRASYVAQVDSVRRRYSPRTDTLRLPTILHVDSTQKHSETVLTHSHRLKEVLEKEAAASSHPARLRSTLLESSRRP